MNRKANNEYQISKQPIEKLCLYYNDRVEEITEQSNFYEELTDEVLEIINSSQACEDTIDGFLAYNGNGIPLRQDVQNYFVEVNFIEALTVQYLDKEITDIVRIVISLDTNCIYLYKEGQEKLSFIGYGWKENTMDKLYATVKEFFDN